MKQVVHVFPSFADHLSVPLAKYFLAQDDKSNYKQKVIIYGKEKKEMYKFNKELILVDSPLKLLLFFVKHINSNFIVHSGLFTILLLLCFFSNKINWVCWGSETKTNKSLFSRLTYPVKWGLFHRLAYIITLMDDDKNDLVSTYNLRNVKVIPYPNVDDAYYFDMIHFNKPQNTPLRILVGNNGYNFNSYMQILPSLLRFKDMIEIHCMFQYPNFQDKKQALLEFGKKLFNEKFYIDDCMLDRERYFDYMASYDIYICHSNVQTGLGAIYNSLFFGKKVYLNGKNLSWCKSLHLKVFDTNEIVNSSQEVFLSDISKNEKMLNRSIIINFLTDKVNKWHDFLLGL